MFARLKPSTNDRVYVQVIHSYRRSGALCGESPKQKVVATLGRVDHLPERERLLVVERLNYGLEGIRVTGGKRRRAWEIRQDAADAERRERGEKVAADG